jgi:phage head maturation protease
MDLEQLKEWQRSGHEELSAHITPASVNLENRTVDIVWFTGVDVPRFSFFEGEYTLSFDPEGVDLSLLNNGAPILDDHNLADGLSAQKGVVRKAWKDGDLYKATIQFSRRPEVDGIWQDVQDGILQKFSMGTQILEAKDTRDKDGQLQMRKAKSWRPFELSLTSVPADFGTTTLRREVGAKQVPPEPETAPPAEATPAPATTNEGLSAQEEISMPESQTPAAEALVTPPAVNQEELRRAGQSAERLRISTIRQRCQIAGLSREFEDSLIADDTADGEKLSARIFEAMAGNSERQPETRGHNAATVSVDHRDKLKQGLSAAILYRADPGKIEKFGYKREDAREYASLSLLEMAKESLQAQGTDLRGKSKSEIASLALQTTSDFPNITANVASKSLMQGYEEVARTFTLFARRGTLPDFKLTSRVNLGEAPSLPKVNEAGEFKYVTLTEGGQTYRLYTYGEIVAISRQALINDNLGALTQIPAQMGAAAARTESDIVWGIITSNPTMSDGNALFSSAHGNLAASGTALGLPGLNIGRTSMARQTGRDGKTKIQVRPSFLLLPVTLESAAEQIIFGQTTPAVVGNVTPQYLRNLQPIAEPRLDDSSLTAYYLAAAAGVGGVEAIEYSYLEGNEGVYMEQRVGFNIDGVEHKVRMDFGASALDWRGLYKDPGA